MIQMRTAECRTAIARLSTYITDPGAASADIDAALDHVRDCLDCRYSIGFLVRGSTLDQIDRLDCQRCAERLPEYVEAVVAGQATSADWRAVALHLALCPHCAAAYTELSYMVELAEGRRGVEPPTYPRPDLG